MILEGHNTIFMKWIIIKNMAFSFMISCLPTIFFPLLSQEKYKINNTWIGIVISMGPLKGMLFSIFYQEISRKFSII